MRSFPVILAFAFLAGSVSLPNLAEAQAPPVVDDANSAIPTKGLLPIQAALLHKKLLFQTPDYDALIALNNTLQADTFGREALIAQRKKTLKDQYESFKPGDLILLKKNIALTMTNYKEKTAATPDIPADAPFVFSLTDTDNYGVFIRNGKDLQEFAAPYVASDFLAIQSVLNSANSGKFIANILVKAVLADPKPFVLADESTVLPILVDAVEITVYDPSNQYLVLKKRYMGWEPPTAVKESSLEEELMPILEKRDRKIK